MLGFADGRLRQVESDALGAATDLADALGGPGAGADLAGADAELALARGSLAAFRSDLAGPVSLAASWQAATDLGAALRHVDNAVNLVRPGTNLLALLTAPLTAGVAPAGLAAQLGLSQPSAPTFDGQTLSYRLAADGAATLPGPLPLRVGA